MGLTDFIVRYICACTYILGHLACTYIMYVCMFVHTRACVHVWIDAFGEWPGG